MPKEMLTNPELFVNVASSLKWKIDNVTAYSSKQPEKTGYDTRHINDIAPLIIDVSHLPAEEQEAAYDAEVKKMGAAFYTYDPATDRPYPDAVRPYIVAFFDRIRNITGSEMDWEDPKKIADLLLAMKASQAIGTLVGDFQSIILDLYPDHDSITKFDASVSQTYMLYLKVGVAMARAGVDVEEYVPIGTKHLDSFDQDLQQQVIGAVYDATINGEDTVVLDPTVTDLAKKHFLRIPFSEMHYGGMAEYTNDDYLVDYMNRLSIAYSCTSVEQQMVGRINDGSNGAFNSYDLISINGRTIHEIINEKVNGGSDENTAEREAAQMFREALTDGKSVVDLMSVSFNKDGKVAFHHKNIKVDLNKLNAANKEVNYGRFRKFLDRIGLWKIPNKYPTNDARDAAQVSVKNSDEFKNLLRATEDKLIECYNNLEPTSRAKDITNLFKTIERDEKTDSKNLATEQQINGRESLQIKIDDHVKTNISEPVKVEPTLEKSQIVKSN